MTNTKKKRYKKFKKYIHQLLKFNLSRPSYELYPPWEFWWFQVVDFYNHQSLLESTIFTSANYIEILAFVAGPRGFCKGMAMEKYWCWICLGVCNA